MRMDSLLDVLEAQGEVRAGGHHTIAVDIVGEHRGGNAGMRQVEVVLRRRGRRSFQQRGELESAFVGLDRCLAEFEESVGLDAFGFAHGYLSGCGLPTMMRQSCEEFIVSGKPLFAGVIALAGPTMFRER